MKNYFGLTGGIGAGKTTVSQRFSARGALVLDADAVSRRALEPYGSCYQKAIQLFGKEILCPDGRIDRKRVAAIVFADDAMRERLNGIVHPAVQSELLTLAGSADPHIPVIFDVPLLFESGWDKWMEKSIVVVMEDALRIERICRRDRCTRAEAAARMAAQMSQREKCARADHVLENNGTLEELYQKVDALYARLCGELVS